MYLEWRSTAYGHRRIVPWYNMAEWNQVYKQVFSDDTTAQMKGLERLLVWRARYPECVPIGVQCTTDLLQVCLKDRELWPLIISGTLPQYNEQYLQSMYAIAVMRFLNHATSMCTTRISMYVKAKELEIPDWVVNVRHETAHSRNLAPLNVLRNAADFCLNWIHENYWKNETEVTADWVLCENVKDFSEILKILEMWKAVVLYSKVGITSYRDIPDVDLQKSLLDLLQDYDSTVIKKMKTQLETRGYTVEHNEMESAKLSVIKEFKECVINLDAYSEVVDLLLEYDGFLPSSDFLSAFNTHYDRWRLQNNSLPMHFISLWMSLLEFLPQDKIIPILLRKLILLTSNAKESSHRKRMAALWINELALSLYKLKQFENLKNHLRFRWGNVEEFYKKVMEEVEEQDPNLKQIITLNMQRVPKSVTDLSLLNEVLDNPNQWTNIILSSVMDIMEPPLSKDTKEKLATLVKVCTPQELSTSKTQDAWKDSPVYTVSNLLKINKVEKLDVEETVVNCTDGSSENIDSDWIPCDRTINWGSCPLGKLPSQDIGPEENFIDLSMNTVWQVAEQSDEENLVEKSLPGFFHQKIDGNKIKRKHPQVDSAQELIEVC